MMIRVTDSANPQGLQRHGLMRNQNQVFRWLALLALSVLCLIPHQGSANNSESIRVSQTLVSESAEGAWAIDAQVDVTLSPVLIDAVKRGVPLYFVSEFELSKSRWYWFDQKVAAQSKVVRISYHALTQQFRIAVAGLHQMSYPTLDEALTSALRIRGWQVIDPPSFAQLGGRGFVLQNKDALEARLRVRLDSALLPKPLQVDALTSRDWKLTSDWISLALPGDAAAAFFILKGVSQ